MCHQFHSVIFVMPDEFSFCFNEFPAPCSHNPVCNDFHHVRTWAVTRFRGIISTQPISTPVGSFNVTTLDTNNPQQLVDSVLEAAQRCATRTSQVSDVVRTPSNICSASATRAPPADTGSNARAHSSFRVPHWKTRSSSSRSPGSRPDEPGPNLGDFPNPVLRAHPSNVNRIGFPDHSNSDAGANSFANGQNDLVVLPRTTWLHEDDG